MQEVVDIGLVHSFDDKAKGASSSGRDLYQPLPGAEPKGEKNASDDKACVKGGNADPAADADDGHKKREHGEDEVENIVPVEVFDGADVFEEDGDLVGFPPYLIGHVDTLIGENDLVIVGADQQVFVG